ncbi:hypothetical protein BS47DRAFT_1295824 [Hydnum rufescens UP504]|uniref:EXS domain-containing protein n=1 Tax=Hydnum rufescens UP504 TaxID=1448309 RepID=A0A9P6DWJ6_9AGAM|nr:hypothetical protein BS47DRAFT_1295824 [Hydnum rufescens UP504]
MFLPVASGCPLRDSFVAWLVFALVLILAPLPIYTRPSRWWLVRKVGKLLVSGTSRVEAIIFSADFWMGDQLCSLTFSLSTLWTFGCAYQNHWLADTYTKCGVSKQWGVPFALSALPAVLRLIQCIKRYEDSGLYTHLINGGKYFSSIMYYVFYFLWRTKGAQLEGYHFVLFCTFASIMSTYSAGWDFLMDWSVLDPKAQYKFLRSDLIYTNSIPFYYFAIIYNVIVRFAWIGFLPYPSSHFVVTTRSFVFAILEVVRRVGWNLLRLENEHIGNMDQYRVTREVPLPYSFQDDDENDVDSESDGRSERSTTVRGKRTGLRTKSSVHLPTVDNSGQV